MQINRKVIIHAYKFNGWLYRTWEFPTIIKETDEYICVVTENTKVITAADDLKHFYHSKINRPSVWYFFKHEWYNMIVSEKNNKYYCYINVASPFIMEHGIIKYIDFDLDFRIPNAKGDIINEVDLDEYSENKVKYQYPQKLIEKIKIVEADIVKSFKNREFDQYIDRELIDYYNRHMKTKRNNDE
ncbi:MAG: DUF402 domain-containing protein [Mycoplasmataceae bacterium]|nr:DUF402 domain-containing protein [Mycoplasmataceae bacterium]